MRPGQHGVSGSRAGPRDARRAGSGPRQLLAQDAVEGIALERDQLDAGRALWTRTSSPEPISRETCPSTVTRARAPGTESRIRPSRRSDHEGPEAHGVGRWAWRQPSTVGRTMDPPAESE